VDGGVLPAGGAGDAAGLGAGPPAGSLGAFRGAGGCLVAETGSSRCTGLLGCATGILWLRHNLMGTWRSSSRPGI